MLRLTGILVEIPALDRLVTLIEAIRQDAKTQDQVDLLTGKARDINSALAQDNTALEDAVKQST